ncbi:YtxH domain-containing protein [Spirosoma pomorum]
MLPINYKRKDTLDQLASQYNLVGTLISGAVGLVIGFLVAPQSGKRLRDKLIGAAKDESDELRHQWRKGKSQAKQTFSDATSDTKALVNDVQDEFDAYTDKAKSSAQASIDKIRDIDNNLVH